MSWKILTILLISSLVTGRNIYISRDHHSEDEINCGFIDQPCATLQYAITISRDFDTILLDAEYEFNHISCLIINKNINITSFRMTHSAKYATINLDRFQTDNVFRISTNVSFSNLKIVPTTSYLTDIFELETQIGSIYMVNCFLEFRLRADIFQFYNYHTVNSSWTLTFEQVKFKISYPVKKKLKQTKDVQTINRQIYNKVTINFIESKFEWFFIGITGRFVNVDRCYFFKSIVRFMASNSRLILPSQLNIYNTNFTNSGISYLDFPENGHFVSLMMVNNTFDGTFDYYADTGSGNFQVEIKGINSNNIKLYIESCVFKNAKYGCLYLIKTTTLISNTNFTHNILDNGKFMPSYFAAALIVKNSYLNIDKCIFVNNSADQPKAGSIYVSLKFYEKPHNSFTMTNTIIKAGIYLSKKESTSVMIPSLEKDGAGLFEFINTTIKCPVNHLKEQSFFVQHYLILSCIKCDGDSYNAGEPSQLSWGEEGELINDEDIECYSCPYQASCIQNIRSKGNYWGYLNNSGGVHFLLCPPSYCCSTLSTCTSYDTCMNKRNGRLCGECLTGYSISLFGPNKCTLSKDCSSKHFWIGYVFVVIFCCLFFMYYKGLFTYVRSLLTRKQSDEEYKAYHILTDDMTSEVERSLFDASKNFHISGLIKITFFFYQTASIIRINAAIKNEYSMPFFIDLLSSFFNLKIDVKSSSLIDICPLKTDNVVKMEFIRISPVFAALALLLMTMALLGIIMRWVNIPSTFICRLKGAYLQILLMGYAVISMFFLQAVHCINIQDGSYLYIQASIECYTPWQQFMISIIVLWVIPFPMAVYVNCRLLRLSLISSNQFLMASTFPPFSIYFSVMKTNDEDINEHDRQEAEHLLSILNEPFKTLQNGNRMIWEPVLLYRRLFLLPCSTFIVSPVEKLFPVGMLLLLFTIHDALVQPYVGRILNKLQTITFQLLGLLTLINLFWAFSNDVDFTQNANLKMLGKIFLLFELFVLTVPVLFVLFYILFYKLGKFILKLIFRKQE